MNKIISDEHPKLFGLIILDDKGDLTASHQISGKTIIWRKKKDVQTFSYKVKDSRQCAWHGFLPLGSPSIPWNIYLNFRSSWSLLLVFEKLFFWSCLTMTTLIETICLSADAPQLLSWRFLAGLSWLFLDGSPTLASHFSRTLCFECLKMSIDTLDDPLQEIFSFCRYELNASWTRIFFWRIYSINLIGCLLCWSLEFKDKVLIYCLLLNRSGHGIRQQVQI